MKRRARRTVKDSVITFRLEGELALAIEEIAAELQVSQGQLLRLTMRELAQRLKVLSPPEDEAAGARGKIFETSYSWPYKRE